MVVAFVVEMMMPTFFAMLAGFGFLASAAISYFYPDTLVFQIIAAAVVMVIGAVILKKQKIGDADHDVVGTHNEFAGIKGKVLSTLTEEEEGEVELYEAIIGNRRWHALSTKGSIEPNTTIKVTQLRGNTLIVEPN